MTAAEVIHVIRTVLDDGLFWYLGFPEINNCVNQAQMQMINKYHAMDDERALRTLYQYDENLIQNGVLSKDILFPRAARIFENDEEVDFDTWVAEFLSYDIFINYTTHGFAYGKSMPRSAYWTFYKVMNTTIVPPVFESRVKFSTGTIDATGTATSVCNVLYIATPPTFHYQADALNSVPLSLPDEYHMEITLLAAEIANTIDVGEQERGDVAIQQAGQKLNLENTVG